MKIINYDFYSELFTKCLLSFKIEVIIDIKH